MEKTLPIALDLMFGHEGGYSSAKTDSGNFFNGVLVGTKYGVTGKTLAAHRGVKTITAADVKAMTRAEAEAIYRKSYWKQSGGDLLPVGLDYAAFDFGVNSGPATAVKKLQKVLGVNEDGVVGGVTVDACRDYQGGIEKLIRDYCDERMRYLRSLGGKQGWSANGRGWTIRVTGIDPKGQWKPQLGVVGNALKLTAGQKPAMPDKPNVSDGKAPVENTSLIEVAKKPEAWGPLAGLVSALGGLFSDNTPLQYALAFGVVVGVCIGVFYFIRRVRRGS